NLLARRITSGFGFLLREAGFEIGETTFLSYHTGDTYLRALAVGLFNTFRVAALAIIFSTPLGISIGLARLSPGDGNLSQQSRFRVSDPWLWDALRAGLSGPQRF